MQSNDPIVLPAVHARSPKLGPVAVMVATMDDTARARECMMLPHCSHLYLSRLFHDTNNAHVPCLIGPVLGAPYAVMLLENLRVWGVTKIIFIGWCGSIYKELGIGDILLPDGAFIDEGTSLHYEQRCGAEVKTDQSLFRSAAEVLIAQGTAYHTGAVWTTDGVFRETQAKVIKFRKKGALAVEMEFSALLSAAAFHGLAVVGMLAVSDELFTGRWRPGFKNEAFIQARGRLIKAATSLAVDLEST
jgi:purine-nucleoside phosphorylase